MSSLGPEPEPVSSDELAVLLRFLGRLWLCDFDAPLRAQLLGPLSDAWCEIGGALPTESLDELQADYCRLFAHPQTYVAPIQSVWTTGQLDGPPAQSMRRYAKETGYADAVSMDEIADHLGLQLDLAGWMLAHASSAAMGDDTSIVREVMAQFVAEHLGWCEPMFERVGNEGETDFYRCLTDVTRGMIDEVR